MDKHFVLTLDDVITLGMVGLCLAVLLILGVTRGVIALIEKIRK